MERLRVRMLGGAPHNDVQEEDGLGRTVVFRAALGVSFAVVSVCLHEAMTTYLVVKDASHGASGGAAAGLQLTMAWALVPVAVTLAWLTARDWFSIAVGALAAASPIIAGVLFDWGAEAIVTTMVPSAFILGLGYRVMSDKEGARAYRGCAAVVALTAAVWLLIARIVDTVLQARGLGQFDLYTSPDFWVDFRYYVGWTLGLLLAPYPHPRPVAPARPG